MERYKNFVRLEQMKENIRSGRTDAALELAEQLNPEKIKSTSDLNILADLYLENGMLAKASECLTELYSRKKTRSVLMQLINLSVRLKKANDAEKYFREFKAMSSGDFYNYIFRYNIDKIEGKSYDVLIPSLEKLKEAEYIELWAYELAKLYHKAGRKEDCLRECNDIEIWFGEGEYVDRARALKAYYMGELDITEVPNANKKAVSAETATDMRGNKAVDEPMADMKGNKAADEPVAESTAASDKEEEYELVDYTDEDFAEAGVEGYGKSSETQAAGTEEVVEIESEAIEEAAEEIIEIEAEAVPVTEEAEEIAEAESVAEDVKEVSEAEAETVTEEAEEITEIEAEPVSVKVEEATEIETEAVSPEIGEITETEVENVSAKTEEHNQREVEDISAEVEILSEAKAETVPAEAEENSKAESEPEVSVSDKIGDDIFSDKEMEITLAAEVLAEIEGYEDEQKTEELQNAESSLTRETGADAAGEESKANAEPELVEHEFKALRTVKIAQDSLLATFLEKQNAELEDYFGFFAYQSDLRSQIIKILEILLNPQIKNKSLVISGEHNSGMKSIIKGMTRIMYQSGFLKGQQVAFTDAEKINTMKLADKMDRLEGCCLTINQAGRLSSNAAQQLLDISGSLTGKTMVVLTDYRSELNRLFRDYRDLNSMFPQRIHIPAFDKEDLEELVFVRLAADGYRIEKSAHEQVQKELRRIVREVREGSLAEADKYISGIIDSIETRNAKKLMESGFAVTAETDRTVNLSDVLGYEE